MLQRGSNLPRVGDYNQVLVVDLVRRHPGISRVELTEQTGLSTQTVSNICRRLVDLGMIRELGRISSDVGGRRTVYETVPGSRCALGLHIDPGRMELALVDLAGHVVTRESLPLPEGGAPGSVLDLVVSRVRAMLDGADLGPDQLSGLGVSTPGPLIVRTGAVVRPPNLRGWDVVSLRDELGGRLRLPVQIEKDTIAAATGELWAGHVASQDFAFVYLGTGAGAGIVLGGEVLHGASGNLGNFGHISGDPDGPRCECGGRGCLATSAAPAVLVAEAQGRGLLSADLPLDDPRSVERGLARLADLARDGDAGARTILERAARSFGRVAANLVNTLDLDLVVFGGPHWRYLSDVFMAVVPGVVADLHLFGRVHGVRVQGTALGEDAGPIGAASLVLSAAVSARPSQLVLPV